MKDREESALVQAKKQLQQFWQDTGVTCDERLLKAFRQLYREEFVSPIHRGKRLHGLPAADWFQPDHLPTHYCDDDAPLAGGGSTTPSTRSRRW